MRFGLFYEHQLPRPWSDGDEERLLTDALEQIELADRVGIDHVWEVEHHFLEEYSHSSAPEVFLAAASQRTSRIRLGHGIVQLPPQFNHPARIAERIATLDLISGGRVEFGTGEASSQAELGGFGVPRAAKRDQWTEALDVVTRMMVEEPFAGHAGQWIDIPPRNVVPKPKQRPHPPLWVACSRRETIELAARKGMGALSFAFVEPEEAKPWVEAYYDLIASPECVPGGFDVNPNLAVVVPFMCHRDEVTAIERGIDGAHFFGYSLAHYYVFGRHRPAQTDIWSEFEQYRAERGFARDLITAEDGSLNVNVFQGALGSLRGAVGTPDQIADLISRYQDVGVDQIIFVAQAGRNRHEHICEAIELFGAEVLPRFAEGREEREAEKAERLAPAIEAALARRPPARTGAGGNYVVAPSGEASAARTPRIHLPNPVRQITPQRLAEKGVEQVMRLALRAVPAPRLARFAVSNTGADMFRRGMERLLQAADLSKAGEVTMHYVLDGPTTGGWTVEVAGGSVRTHRGHVGRPDTVIRMDGLDFIRIAAGVLGPGEALFQGRIVIEGDEDKAIAVMTNLGSASYF